MLLLDAQNLEDYLRSTGRIAPEQPVHVRELAGGVSNVVLLVCDHDEKPLFVVKQARQQLRVPDPWFCSTDRIWREVAVLETIHEILEQESRLPHEGESFSIGAPGVLFRDHDQYLYGMTAAPPHAVWKSQLLQGDLDARVAAGCGRMLGAIHSATWQDAKCTAQFADWNFFDALRLDPYFRHIGRQHAELRGTMDSLIDSLAAHRRCLVHGDFSPKNILVHGVGLTLVDFEVGHFGDPAFDLGFFLTHLHLKTIRDRARQAKFLELIDLFWEAYERRLRPACGASEFAALVARAIRQLAGCMLARVAGKSRVEYLDADQQQTVWRLATDWLDDPPADWPTTRERLQRELASRYSGV